MMGKRGHGRKVVSIFRIHVCFDLVFALLLYNRRLGSSIDRKVPRVSSIEVLWVFLVEYLVEMISLSGGLGTS